MEGERKLVTVLFADVAGFTTLSEKLDPEEVHGIMDGCFKILMDEIHRYEGTINQFTGDGVMALFGAPIAHEDHAVRACYAALRMQEAVKRYAGETRRVSGNPLAIRIGLNSGEVVVRSIGSDLHMDYTAVGQTTHLAARMEQAALPGSTVLTLDTLRLAEEINAAGAKLNLRPKVLLQVNTSDEPQKYGVPVGAATHLAEQIETLPNVQLVGLMTMAPLTHNKDIVRSCFVRARELFVEMRGEKIVGPQFTELSMGMSSDYELAVEEGATILRIGSAIFAG